MPTGRGAPKNYFRFLIYTPKYIEKKINSYPFLMDMYPNFTKINPNKFILFHPWIKLAT